MIGIRAKIIKNKKNQENKIILVKIKLLLDAYVYYVLFQMIIEEDLELM
jgi:hypothetical protein